MSRAALHLFENFCRHPSILHCLNTATIPLSEARQAHAHILKTGVFTDIYIATRLVSLYANHHSFVDATLVVDSVPEPTVFPYSSLIFAFIKNNQFGHAINAFSRMLSRTIMPDDHVFPSIIKACAGLMALEVGRQVHCIASVFGFESDAIVQCALFQMYIKCNRVRDARNMFDRLSQPNVVACGALLACYARLGLVGQVKELLCKMGDLGVKANLVCWNGMITGFTHSGIYMEAMLTFQKMHSEGFMAEEYNISSVLPAVGGSEKLGLGIQIHGSVIKQGLTQNERTVSALIDMYGKCGRMSEMLRVFEEMNKMDICAFNALITGLSRNDRVDYALKVFREFKGKGLELNVVSWTSMIAGCSQSGKDIKALDLFREMQIEGVKPNSITIPCMLPACGNIAALMHGKAAHGFSVRMGMSNDVHVGTALIDMYAKCGRINLSRLCFNKMPTKNLVSWNAMMSGYAMHGQAKETIDMFHMMQRSGQKPSFISFTCVLSACSKSGLIDEGWHYFNSMSKKHGIKAGMEHYSCMVTLLGRAGRLEDAYTMIKEMPFEPDACVWGSLLSSCRVYNNETLGEAAAKKLFELEPINPGNYVLLSNIYASKGMWVQANTIRDTMKSMGVRKKPGCSWIEIKSKVHMLLAGDNAHPQMNQIIEKLDKLRTEMKNAGYFPHTGFVLQDVDEQDKEQILCGHSEKLAVVLGLLNTSPGSPLQVIKNLRICGDCHAAIKFISSFEGREIFVRDTNRFHHFKDGVCTCGDYW